MARIAVVGAGAAGLSAAYHLRGRADVTLFEKEDVAGGHAHSVEVVDGGRTIGLDTAFIVYNEPHYPRLTRFFADLGVETQSHPGKFSFYDMDTTTGYVSDDFDLSEDEIRAKYPPKFVRIWSEAERFYEQSAKDFIRKRAEMPLGEYLERNGYSDEFRFGFVVLIATAAWSVPADRVWEMPASTVIAFFLGHGREGLGGRTVPWRTVTGGSVSYVRAALKSMREAGHTIRLGTLVTGVVEETDGVAVRTADGVERFDQVILAGHADDSLGLLARPTEIQGQLEVVKYHTTKTVLHTDRLCMPGDREQWRSWNYVRSGGNDDMRTWVVYYLNQLHEFSSETDYFLTLECGVEIDPDKVVADLRFRHPIFTAQTRELQANIRSVNNDESRVKFAGSYFYSRKMGPDVIGSHESAFDSGAAAADSVMSTFIG